MAEAKNFYSLIEEKETKTILSVLVLILTASKINDTDFRRHSRSY